MRLKHLLASVAMTATALVATGIALSRSTEGASGWHRGRGAPAGG